MNVTKYIMFVSCLVLTPVLVFSAPLPQYDVLPFIDEGIKGPMRVAVGPNDEIYVTDNLRHKVIAYSNNGVKLFNITDMKNPLGVAVDGNGNILVGDGETQGVRFYSGDGEYLYSVGEGLIQMPSDIAVDSNGTLYVVDSGGAVVHVFDPAGNPTGSIGSGSLSHPVMIAIDKTVVPEEIYVSDMMANKVVTYDLSGNILGTIAGGGGSFGKAGAISMPQGVSVDADYIYMADSYYSVIAVYDKSRSFIGYLGENGGGAGNLKIPVDIDMDSNNKMHIANFDQGRLEVFGLDDYTEWDINPSRMDIAVYEKGNPVTQGVFVSANKPLNFTVTTDAAWLTAIPANGTTDDVVEVTVNPLAMTAGSYTGTVSILSDNRTENRVSVNVTVLRDYSMIVTPGSLTLTYQKGSDSVPEGTILVDTGGSNFSWTASASEGWAGLSRTSGNTGSDPTITITPDVGDLHVGTYHGVVDIVAETGVSGSPATVDVTLNIVKAGSIVVNANLDQASFTITGPATHSGSGKVWSAGDVPQGRYEIVFDHVPGYVKPAARHFYVQSGKEVVIDGTYKTKKAANSIAALSSGADADTVSITDSLTGAPVGSFGIPVGNAEIVTGDYDGDGIDEIAVLSNGQSLKLYEYDGTEAGSLDFAGTVKGIESADLNGDGDDDLIVAVHNKRGISVRVIYLIDCGAVGNKKLIRASGSGDSTIASGDFNGDGIADIAIADSTSVQVYDISSRKSRKMTSFAHQSMNVPRITAGDLDDDGIYEIIMSEEDITNSNSVRILNADGSDYADQIGLTGYAGVADVTSGDTDNDGLVEIVVADTTSDEVKTYEDDGSGSGTMDTLTGSTGIRVAVGGF